jgi:hypothetical protein
VTEAVPILLCKLCQTVRVEFCQRVQPLSSARCTSVRDVLGMCRLRPTGRAPFELGEVAEPVAGQSSRACLLLVKPLLARGVPWLSAASITDHHTECRSYLPNTHGVERGDAAESTARSSGLRVPPV